MMHNTRLACANLLEEAPNDKRQTRLVRSSVATRTLITMIASVNNYERTCTRAPLKTRQKSTTSRPSTRSTLTPVATKNERRREKNDTGVVVAYAVYSGGHVSAKWDEGEALNRV